MGDCLWAPENLGQWMGSERQALPALTMDPREGTVAGPSGRVRLEPKVMEVLSVLAKYPGQVVSRDELLNAVWPGMVVTEHTLSRCIYQLRHQLGEIGAQPGQADFNPIETLPKRGYRLLEPVAEVRSEDLSVEHPQPWHSKRSRAIGAAIGVCVVAAAGLLFLLYSQVIDRTTAIDGSTATIAVLPFENRSPDPENAYFADGIHDDLLMLLSKLRDMKVVSRTSVETFRDTEQAIPEIGRSLGVEHVLEGAVQRVGNNVRINVQLIAAATDEHVWAEAYDRQLTATNIFTIQSEVAKAIADALHATLSPEEQERLEIVPTDSLPAYEAYLLGKQRMARRTSIALTEAIEFFQQSIALDPQFALAYVGLADSYSIQSIYSGAPLDEVSSRATAAIDKALAIDDRLGEAYTSLGWLRQLTRDFDGAEKAYRKALELQPNYATIHHRYGNLLRILGQPEAALAQHEKGLQLDPLSAIIHLNVARDLEGLGWFDQALARYGKIIEIDPAFPLAYASIADLHWAANGALDQAVLWYQRSMSQDPKNPVTSAWLGRLYLDLSDENEAASWINRAMKLGPESADANYAVALLHLHRRDEAQSLEHAEKVLAVNSLWVPSVLALLRNGDLAVGEFDRARARYEKHYPSLLSEDEPAVNNTNYRAAIDLALVLRQTGDHERADLLLARSLAFIHTIPRAGTLGYGALDASIYALKGRTNRALAALSQAIDQGWRSEWWYFLERDPNLASIRQEPEFQAMLAGIKKDMAAQLRRVQEMG